MRQSSKAHVTSAHISVTTIHPRGHLELQGRLGNVVQLCTQKEEESWHMKGPWHICDINNKVRSRGDMNAWLKVQFSSVQLLSHVRLFETPWTAAHEASLSVTNSRSLLKLRSIEQVMLFNHLILCRSLLLPTSIFPSIRVFSNESVLHISWPKYWSFSFSISPSN